MSLSGGKLSLGGALLVGFLENGVRLKQTSSVTHVVQGCIAFRTECREVMLDGYPNTKVIMPGMEKKNTQRRR